jgi:hypothetical protein
MMPAQALSKQVIQLRHSNAPFPAIEAPCPSGPTVQKLTTPTCARTEQIGRVAAECPEQGRVIAETGHEIRWNRAVRR